MRETGCARLRPDRSRAWGAPVLVIPVVLFVFALLAGCVRAGLPGGPPRGIVVVLLDTVRADHLSAYGYERETTPNLAKLAAEGVRFDAALAPAPWTIPSLASLWTGVHPRRHGAGLVAEEGELRSFTGPSSMRGFSESVPTLPVELQSRGYRTFGRVANKLLDQDCFRRGFDEIQVAPGPAGTVVAWVEKRLDALRAGPFFLYVHFMDSHVRIDAPPEHLLRFLAPAERAEAERDLAAFRERVGRWDVYDELENLGGPEFEGYARLRTAAYDGTLSFQDAEIGRLVALLRGAGLFDETLFVVTADHGEELWDHWELERDAYPTPDRRIGFGHGHTLFGELLRVPLVVRGPGVVAGRVVGERVELLDLGTTLLEIVGPDKSSSYLGAGRSLVPALRGDALAPSPTPSVAESLCYGHELGAIVDAGGMKLVAATHAGERDLLFDLAADPGETRDLAGERPELVARLRAELAEWRRMFDANAFEPGARADRVDVPSLEDLGYLGD